MRQTESRNGVAHWRWRAFALWFFLGLLLWWGLTEGDPKGLPMMLPAALLTAAAGALLARPWQHRCRLLALPGFIFFFLRQSLIAGADVARRTLLPRMPMATTLIEVPLHLPEGAPRWLLANTLSLLPGTLTVNVNSQHLQLHVLDRHQPITAQVADTQTRIARLFGLEHPA